MTMTYLEELVGLDEPTFEFDQGEAMERVEGWIIHADAKGSIRDAKQLWNAVAAGVEASGDLVEDKDKALWGEVSKWLTARTASQV